MPFQDLAGLLCPLHPTLESVEQNQPPIGHLSVEATRHPKLLGWMHMQHTRW